MGAARTPAAALLALLFAAVAAACGVADDALRPAAATCLNSAGADDLSTLFEHEPGDVIAADYQRVIALPDGRNLWLFQDATIRLPPPTPTATTTLPGTPEPPEPPTERLLHNIGMIQTGTCFEVLRSGTADDPGPWLFADQTTPFGHWFWPLDATMGDDGYLYVFVAEMLERGPLYLSQADPVSTRIVQVDVVTMQTGFTGRPPNDSASLYGFSITSDDTWTYLYAQCHRQFGWDPGPLGVDAHDFSCSANVPVGRVSKGRPFDSPTYWDGATWTPEANSAVAVMPTTGRRINPSQVRWTGEEFIAVTKVDDWFGTTIHLDRAPNAHGPWTTYARVPAHPKCSPLVCNTYFASWVPGADVDGRMTIGLSHNRWDGRVSTINRPSFFTVPAPGEFAFATRCTIVDC